MSTVPLFVPVHEPSMATAVDRVLRSGQVAAGPLVAAFESAFAAQVGLPHTVLTVDMSMAVQMALRLSGVGPGDEVIASPFACMSTNAPIATAGAVPVWADVDPLTGMPDAQHVQARISPRTKAVLIYHASGYPARAAAIAEVCRRHGIALIEDCDNALGALSQGQPVGHHGDFAVWSFYPNRQINAGEGGALSCRRPQDAERAKRLRRFGIDLARFRDASGEISDTFDIPEVGWSGTMNSLCCAMALEQLDGLAQRQRRTLDVASQYDRGFSGVRGVRPVPVHEGGRSAFWTYLVTVDNARDTMAALKARGISTSGLHDRTDRYTGFKADSPELPGVDDWMHHHLALPCGYWMSDSDVAHTVQTLIDITK